MTHPVTLRAVLWLALVLPAAAAAQDPVIGYHVATGIGWSAVSNVSGTPLVSSPVVITQTSSPWLKLWFASVDLGAGSKIRLTGAQDDVVQVLDADALAAWSDSSAYFNGDTVVVELIVAPGDTASAIVAGYDAGLFGVVGIDDICGPTDDRVPSTERRVGRLINAMTNTDCSGGLVSTNSCYLTAGHCVTIGSVFTIEFNCPPSTPAGAIVHPAPQDQYPLDYSTLGFVDAGMGNDWALARLHHNTSTGLPASLVQGHYALAATVPAVGTLIRVTGFGTATGALNFASTTSTGPLTTVSGTTTVGYQVDLTNGNSGSSLIRESNQTVIGICTHHGCMYGWAGYQNWGTAITHPGPQAQYALICWPNPPAYAIAATQAGAGAPIVLNVTGAPPSSELYNLVSLTPATPTNSGPIAGLTIGTTELIGLIALPLGSNPFHVLGAAAGTYSFSAPTGLPGTLVSLDLVSVAFAPGGGVTSYRGRSPAVNVTLLL